MSVYWLAEKLGKFVHELEEELTPADLAEYLAYFKLKGEEEEKARKQVAKKPTPRARRR